MPGKFDFLPELLFWNGWKFTDDEYVHFCLSYYQCLVLPLRCTASLVPLHTVPSTVQPLQIHIKILYRIYLMLTESEAWGMVEESRHERKGSSKCLLHLDLFRSTVFKNVAFWQRTCLYSDIFQLVSSWIAKTSEKRKKSNDGRVFQWTSKFVMPFKTYCCMRELSVLVMILDNLFWCAFISSKFSSSVRLEMFCW